MHRKKRKYLCKTNFRGGRYFNVSSGYKYEVHCYEKEITFLYEY